MGGVTQDEHIAVAPAVGHLRAEGVRGDAHQPQLLGGCVTQPRRDQRLNVGDVLVVGGGFPVEQPEFPTVAGLADPHVGAGALGTAQLVAALPLVEFGVGVHVDHQPGLLERQPVHVGADPGAYRAVGAVAAQHVAGLHAVFAAAHTVKEAHPDPVGLGLGDAGDLDIAPNFRRAGMS